MGATRRHIGAYDRDPVTGHKKRPMITLEVNLKRFDQISKKIDDAIEEGNFCYFNSHFMMPGLARWYMKKQRGLVSRP